MIASLLRQRDDGRARRRLEKLIHQDDRLAADTRTLRFLIIDEADRMIENGHFAELESIVRLTQRQGA